MKTREHPKGLKEIVEYINQNLGKPITSNKIRQIAKISPSWTFTLMSTLVEEFGGEKLRREKIYTQLKYIFPKHIDLYEATYKIRKRFQDEKQQQNAKYYLLPQQRKHGRNKR